MSLLIGKTCLCAKIRMDISLLIRPTHRQVEVVKVDRSLVEQYNDMCSRRTQALQSPSAKRKVQLIATMYSQTGRFFAAS